jgi:NitT/TauT family transport system substrate-binding protein
MRAAACPRPGLPPPLNNAWVRPTKTSLEETTMKKLLLAGFCLAFCSAAHAQTISIVVGGMNKQIYLPAELAVKLGYFQKEGLDVQITDQQAGVDGATALLAGEVQGVVGFYDHTIDLQGKGKYAESIVQFSRAPGEVELVSTKIAANVHSFADLKGDTLGVTGLGSSTNFLTEYLAQQAGLGPSDISTVGVGAGATFIGAMEHNQIQAGMTTEPTISKAQSKGLATILVDLRSDAGTRAALGGPYPAACLYMSNAYVVDHPDVTQKLANAFVLTLHYIATHTAAQIADQLPADYYGGDKAGYIKALAAEKSMFTPDGIMPADGPATVLKVLSSFDPGVKGASIDVSKTYTTSFATKANGG